jgi:hypothetical protein
MLSGAAQADWIMDFETDTTNAAGGSVNLLFGIWGAEELVPNDALLYPDPIPFGSGGSTNTIYHNTGRQVAAGQGANTSDGFIRFWTIDPLAADPTAAGALPASTNAANPTNEWSAGIWTSCEFYFTPRGMGSGFDNFENVEFDFKFGAAHSSGDTYVRPMAGEQGADGEPWKQGITNGNWKVTDITDCDKTETWTHRTIPTAWFATQAAGSGGTLYYDGTTGELGADSIYFDMGGTSSFAGGGTFARDFYVDNVALTGGTLGVNDWTLY